jgi:chemotaxis protein histidine kinase CheA
VEEIEKTKNANREEMEMLQKILHVEGGTLLAFLESAKQDAEAINEGLKDAGTGADNSGYRERLDSLFRHSHSLKGDAELLALDFLADQAEQLEQKIAALRQKEELSGEDFLPLAFSCSGLLSILERLNAIVTKWLALSASIRSDTVRLGAGPGLMENSLKEMARRLAGRYGKQVELRVTGLEERSFTPESHKALKDILVQLVRNSVYHGIEKPEQRRKAGKAESGLISIRAAGEGSDLRIVDRDDGAGIDVEKIKEKAVKSGVITREKVETMNPREQALLIFHSGFSTAENPDRVAGKGVGLSLIKDRVKELKGRLSLQFRRGSHSEFTMVFPLHVLTGGEEKAYKTSA